MTVALTAAHRAELKLLTGLASRDLSLIWKRFNLADAAGVRDGLAAILPDLVAMYGAAAATLGADWYDEVRAAADVDGRFTAVAATLPDVGRTDALAGWAVAPLFSATPDPVSALTLVTGGLQRIVADADRQSVMLSSIRDPAAHGWQRVAAGGCAFCSMLAGRGTVYAESSASFASHDHCHCHAAPAFRGEARPVKAYTPSTRNSTEADRARVREYLRTH